MGPFLTLAEVADLLRLTPGALHAQRYRNQKPGALGFACGKKILYRLADLQAYIDEATTREVST